MDLKKLKTSKKLLEKYCTDALHESYEVVNASPMANSVYMFAM